MRLFSICWMLALSGLAVAYTAAARAEPRPHIVYITVDDLGWKDIGYHGSTIQTPAIDRLAAAGARLEQFYVQPFSSQTRAAALTGRYPSRYGLQTMQIQSFNRYGVPLDERLLPRALKDAGYTTALIGKWHLGHATRAQSPAQRGFDYFYGQLSGEIDYFKKTMPNGTPDWHRNDKPVREPGYSTTLMARDAVRVIGKHDPKSPLFLWLSFSAPQTPLQAPPELIERYHDLSDPQQRVYRAMVSAVDLAVEQVVSALEQRGLLKDTLIWFHANSGGALPHKHATGEGDAAHTNADNGPYRDGRPSLYEGALRAVAFAVWPDKIPPGVVGEPMHAVDVYPTLMRVSGAKLEQPKPLDGVDQWPVITEGKPSARKEVLLNVEEFRGAIRIGDWKLIRIATLPSRTELYNLRADPSEEDNQAERDPERAATMLRRLTDYAWEMAPSLYLEELARPHKTDIPI